MKEVSVIEDNKKEQIKSASSVMGISVGILAGYLTSYIASYDKVNSAISDLADGKMFIIPSISAVFLGIAVGVSAGVITYFMSNLDAERNYNRTDVGGTGGFMSKKEREEYSKDYIYKDPPPIKDNLPVRYDANKDEDKYSKNMILSDTFCRPINSRKLIGNNNIVVVGGAGTGKSRFFIKPNVLQMNASYVITDPSGEMVYSLGKVLSDHGYKIKVFNTQDMSHSNCYNPFEYIRDNVGVDMVIDCLINNTSGTGKTSEDFWVKAEKLLYSACIHYLVDFCNDSTKKNFAGVMSLVNASQVDENNANAKSKVDELFEVLPQDSLAAKNYRAFKQAAGKTLKSIIISCVTRLRPFLTPEVSSLTNNDSIELGNIGFEKTALFIITPQADRTYSFLAAMLYSQLFETLYYQGEKKKAETGDESLPIPVRCMMDEFANIGDIPNFPSLLSTMRKYNISAAIVLQDIAQIQSMYDKDWETIMGNCSTALFLGTKGQGTLKYFSDELGTTTITTKSRSINKGSSGKSFQYTQRAVMTPDELGRLDANDCIVFTQNRRPVLDKKYRYERHPYYDLTGDADDNYGYKYKELAEYNNARTSELNNVILAQQEAENYASKENENSYTFGNIKDDKEERNPFSALNDIDFGRVRENEMYTNSCGEVIESILSSEKDERLVIRLVESIQPKYLAPMVYEIVAETGHTNILVLDELPGITDKLIGYASITNESILNACDNELVYEFERGDNNTAYLVLAKNNIEKFSQLING